MRSRLLSRILSTMSFGTCSYGWSAVAGVVTGTGLFVATLAVMPQANSTDPGYTHSVLMPMLGVFAVAGVIIAEIAAAAFNYFQGRRVQWERELFSGSELPAPMPRPDVPGYDLGLRTEVPREAASR